MVRPRLSFLLLLLCASAATAQIPAFPIVKSAEAFGDRTDVVEVSFQFHFPVDERRYLPVDQELAAILSLAPDVDAPPGMRARVVSSVCTAKEITIYDTRGLATAQGGEMVTKVELHPDPPGATEMQTVTLRYPLIDAVVAKIRGLSIGEAVVKINVQVWPSVAAREASIRAERERARLRQEAAERARRAKEAAEAKARKEARIRFMRKSIPYGIALLLLGFVLFLYRHWISPDLTVTVAGGQHLQKPLPTVQVHAEAEPGTILRTEWARNWMGFRRRIKVESFVSDHARPGGTAHPIDVLVSVGASVRPGKYVATGEHGAVKIVVP